MRFEILLVTLLVRAVIVETKARTTCGKPEVQDSGFRIYDGEVALKGQWPWMVSLEVRRHVELPFEHACGGALMENGWILTAAHCFEYEDLHHYRIVLGRHNRSLVNEEGNQYFAIRKVVDPGTFYIRETDDIAIVKVEGDIVPSKWVQPVCSLRRSEDIEWLDNLLTKDSGSLDCRVAGWGMTEHGSRSDRLRYTEMTVWPRRKCIEEFAEDMYNPKTDLCAQNKDTPLKDACKADSGGPIFCRRYRPNVEKWDRWRLHGIVSWGELCGSEENPPGIYTNVMPYRSWIKNTISKSQGCG